MIVDPMLELEISYTVRNLIIIIIKIQLCLKYYTYPKLTIEYVILFPK